MSVPLLSEQRLTFTQAARELPGRGNKPVNPSTVFRWARGGVRLADGTRVRLEAVRIGSVWFTSREAVARFIDLLTDPADAPAPPRSPAARRRASEAAAAELQRQGA